MLCLGQTLIDITHSLFTLSPIGMANFAYKLFSGCRAFICRSQLTVFPYNLFAFGAISCMHLRDFWIHVGGKVFMQNCTRSCFFLQLNCCVLFCYCRGWPEPIREYKRSRCEGSCYTWLVWLINCIFATIWSVLWHGTGHGVLILATKLQSASTGMRSGLNLTDEKWHFHW